VHHLLIYCIHHFVVARGSNDLNDFLIMTFPTEIKSVFEADAVSQRNTSRRCPPFLPRTLHRRFLAQKTVPHSLTVHLATIMDHKNVVETRSYQRKGDIRCTLCSSRPLVSTSRIHFILVVGNRSHLFLVSDERQARPMDSLCSKAFRIQPGLDKVK
jgi:hypothetical protein